jgi:hypothetical protein
MTSTRPARRRRTGFLPAIDGCEPRLLLSGVFARLSVPAARPVLAHRVHPAAFGLPTPLTDLSGTYMGQDGGLYGGGRNQADPVFATAVGGELSRIVPRDARGRPSPTGRIGLVALGQSTTRMYFSTFESIVRTHPGKLDRITTVNAGQDGNVLQTWAGSDGPWSTTASRVRSVGLSNAQVQVAWLQMAQIYPTQQGDFAQRTAHFGARLRTVLVRARQMFPNLRLVLVSSSMSTEYAPHTVLPEPYAYEDAFAVRAAIQQQEQGDPRWNWNPATGKVATPVVLWGPYVWATSQPRSDGFSWTPADTYDGVHPTARGAAKIAGLLWKQLCNDPWTRTWFLRPAIGHAAR